MSDLVDICLPLGFPHGLLPIEKEICPCDCIKTGKKRKPKIRTKTFQDVEITPILTPAEKIRFQK